MLYERSESNPGSSSTFPQYHYYNVKPDMRFPPADIAKAEPQGYYIATNNTAPSSLDAMRVDVADILGLSYANPYAASTDFAHPWNVIIFDDYNAISSQARTIRCFYLPPRGGDLHEYRTFWYRHRPAGIDPSRLSSRMEHHPLLRIGPAVDTCPITLEEAIALNPGIPKSELDRIYADRLRPPLASLPASENIPATPNTRNRSERTPASLTRPPVTTPRQPTQASAQQAPSRTDYTTQRNRQQQEKLALRSKYEAKTQGMQLLPNSKALVANLRRQYQAEERELNERHRRETQALRGR